VLHRCDTSSDIPEQVSRGSDLGGNLSQGKLKSRGRKDFVGKPNSVCSAAFAVEEAAIYLSDLPITQSRRSGARSGQLPSTPEGVEGAIYVVLHQVGFVLSGSPVKTARIPCGTIAIAGNAVVSYTTISPFPGNPLRNCLDVYFL
jgi:hypothetical protein